MADKFLDKTGLAYFWEKIKAYFQSQHTTPPEYTIVRLANEEVGYAASYVLKKDGTQVGATINIPKDYLVRSGEVKTVTVADEPYEGAVVGDKYLDFVVNTVDDSGNTSHIYIPVSDLVDAYIAGNGIQISDNNYISVKVSQQGVDHGLGVGGDGLTVRMVTPSVNGVGGTHGAMYAADKEKLDNLEIVGVFTTGSDTEPPVEGNDGLVPAPTWAERSKFLRGDGTWAEPGGGGGTPNVGHLKTDNTSALTPSASEPFTSDINLHKVSKTGSYNDLNNTPVYALGESVGGPAKKAISIPFGQVDSTSTSTVFTATVDGITELRDGVCCYLRNGVVTSASGWTLDINGLGAKPVYQTMADASRSATSFNINYTMLFVYNSSRVEGGCWDLFYGYNTNDDYRAYMVNTDKATLPAKFKTYRYRLLFTSADGNYYVGANASTSTKATTAKTPTTEKIDPFGRIIYYGTTTAVNADENFGTSYLYQQNVFTLGYSFNNTGAALVLDYPKPVYIKCAPQTDGSAIIDADNPYVQVLPEEEDGKIYIFLGFAYSETGVELTLEHPIYYYQGGAIRLWTNQVVQDVSDGGNNIVKLNGRSGQYGVTPYSLCAFAVSTSAILEIIEPFTTTGGINGKPVRQGVAFPIGCKIYYHPDYNDISANTDFTSKEFYSTYDEVDARYTAVTGQNISLYSSSQSGVYLRVNVDNGYWSPYYKPNDTTEIIVTPHDFQNGNFYIYLGKTVGSTGYKFQLEDNNPLYYYDGTKLIDWASYQASASMPSYTAGDGISISNGVISCTPRPYKKEVFTAVSFNASSAYQKGWQNFVASSNLEVGTYKVTLQVHIYIVSNTDNMMPAGCVVNAYMRSKATASSEYQYILGATETFSGGVLPETSIPTGRGIISKVLNVVGFLEVTGYEDSNCSLEVGFTTNSSLNVMIGNPTPLDGSYYGYCSGNDFVLLEKIA